MATSTASTPRSRTSRRAKKPGATTRKRASTEPGKATKKRTPRRGTSGAGKSRPKAAPPAKKKTPARTKRSGKAAEGRRAAASPGSATNAHTRQAFGLLLATLGLTLGLAIWTFDPTDGARIASGARPTSNLIGALGHHLAEALLSVLGAGAFVLALVLLTIAALLFSRLRLRVTALEAMGWLAVIACGSTLAHLLAPGARPFHHLPGGLVGLATASFLRASLATVGAAIVTTCTLLLALVLAADLDLRLAAARALRLGHRILDALWRTLTGGLRALWRSHREERARRRSERAAARPAAHDEHEAPAEVVAPGLARAPSEAVVVAGGEARADTAPPALAAEDPSPPPPAATVPPAPEEVQAIAPIAEVPQVRHDPLRDPNLSDPAWVERLAEPRRPVPPLPELTLPSDDPIVTGLTPPAPLPALSTPGEPRTPDTSEVSERPRPATPNDPTPAEVTAAAHDAPTTAPGQPNDTPAREGHEPAPELEIIETHVPKHALPKEQRAFAFTTHGSHFDLPSLDLLDPPPEKHRGEVDEEALKEIARRLCEKLADFKIQGHVRRAHLGPVVTMFEFVPGPGVKISRIENLEDDIAMALEAERVRIVAPLPGKGAVGIEVPNRVRQTVYLREILGQPTFLQAKSKLALGMGMDIEGVPYVVDLAKMPHLLVAGSTGSGKSVSVNAMIASILFRATPEEVRLIMIDPKWTELSLYEGIPHLLLPVVTDPAKAALALRWATEEMDRRYELLSKARVRNLAGYNAQAREEVAAWEARQAALPELPDPSTLPPLDPAREEAEEALKRRLAEDPRPEGPLPLIVIVIDELADLMMVASREVETYIARIAQKARAAGLHLIVATQRPSTDVITGMIKANFPARIGFRVASNHDSKTIINQPGAEQLLGMGDMLMIPPNQSTPLRLHGAFVSDDEVRRLVEHLKRQGEPIYDETILQARDDEREESEEDDDYDPKWDEAIRVVSERERISVSMLQRRMKIGYNRAARMIERMEREGIVGPADGAKPREVLISAPPPTTPPA